MTGNSGKIWALGSPSRRVNRPTGWSQQDLADLYRIGDQLTQLGFPVTVHTGQSDEGDPWAVFEQDRTGTVVVHVARVDGMLVIADVVRERIHRGRDFRTLADRLLADAPLALPQGGSNDKVVLHPRIVIVAFVAAAIAASEFARPASAEAVQDQTTAPPPVAPQPETAPEKMAGRDAVSALSSSSAGGQTLAQNVAIAGLAASLAALSVQPAGADPDLILPGGAVADPSTAPAQGLVTSALDAVRLEWISPLDAEVDLVDSGLAPAVPVARAQGADPAPPAAVSSRAEVPSTAQELALAPTDDTAGPTAQPPRNEPPPEAVVHGAERMPPGPVRTEEAGTGLGSAPDTPSAAMVLEHVTASVKILDAMALPDFGSDDGPNGAIILGLGSLAPAQESIDLTGADTLVTEAHPTATLAVQERFVLAQDPASQLVLDADMPNVIVYLGGDVSVTGFTFGRDRIAFIEDTAAPDWLVSVEIHQDDVVLVGQDGGSVTLLGALATLI